MICIPSVMTPIILQNSNLSIKSFLGQLITLASKVSPLKGHYQQLKVSLDGLEPSAPLIPQLKMSCYPSPKIPFRFGPLP